MLQSKSVPEFVNNSRKGKSKGDCQSSSPLIMKSSYTSAEDTFKT